MDRVAVPGSIGVVAAISWSFRDWLFQCAGTTFGRALVLSVADLWDSAAATAPHSNYWVTLLQTGGALLVLSHWYEVGLILRLILWLIYSGLYLLSTLVNVVIRWVQHWTLGSEYPNRPDRVPQSAERKGDLTCRSMAVVAAQPVPVGTFVLVSRPPEWDEVLVGGYADNGAALCRTTSDDGSAWVWALVNLVAPHFRLPLLGGDGSRTVPPGTPAASVNWICTPPLGQDLWKPSPTKFSAWPRKLQL